MPTKRNYELAVDRTPTTLLGRAISHEIRIEILDLLLKEKNIKSLDLSKKFKTTKSTIHHHLEMLKAADLIFLEYRVHYYELLIPKPRRRLVKDLINLHQLHLD